MHGKERQLGLSFSTGSRIQQYSIEGAAVSRVQNKYKDRIRLQKLTRPECNASSAYASLGFTKRNMLSEHWTSVQPVVQLELHPAGLLDRGNGGVASLQPITFIASLHPNSILPDIHWWAHSPMPPGPFGLLQV